MARHLCLILAAVALWPADADPSIIQFEFAAGTSAEWQPLIAVEQAAVLTGGHAIDGSAFASTVLGAPLASSLFRVRALRKASDPASGYLLSSVPGCILLDAGMRFDVTVHADASALRAIEVRPHSPPGYSGCTRIGESASVAAVTPPQTVGRVLAVLPDEAYSIPALVNAKGLAFPGQREVTETDALLAGGNIAPEQRLALQEKAQEQERKAIEESKTFLEKYWHFLLPVGLFVVMQMTGIGGGGGEAEAPTATTGSSAPGAGARPHAAAAGGGGGRRA